MFPDRLRLLLTISLGGASYTFPSGSIEQFDLHVLSHGFRAEVHFYVSSEDEDDEIFPTFTTDELIQATLSITSSLLDGTDVEPIPITVTGFVTEKSMLEEISDRAENFPVVGRTYRIVFADAAAVLWGQHHPIELYAGASMKEVLTAHKAQGIELVLDWSRLDETLDVLCLSAGVEGQASFHDLLFWYVDRNGGVVELDASSGTYRVGGAKKRPAGEPKLLERDYVERVTVAPCVPLRRAARVLNGHSLLATTTPVPNDQAVAKVSRDALVLTPIAKVATRRQKLEAARMAHGQDEVEVVFGRCPPFLQLPNEFVTLDDDFSKALRASRKVFRVIELHVVVRRSEVEPDPELDDPVRAYQMSLSKRLELASSPRVHLPAYRAPRYPVLVEGKVISASGGDDDRTWLSIVNKSDSTSRYKLDIPLWNKKIPAPFEPNHFPGHFFFPLYKHERVLVALHFDRAHILRQLDWAANARIPMATQGDRLALGYKAPNGTIVDHSYVDSKPVLTIARTFGNDLQTIIVKEGTIYIEVREDPQAKKIEPKFDVLLQVAAAKEQLSAEVQSAVAGLNAAFEGEVGATNAKIDGAIAGLNGELDAAEAKVGAKLAEADAKLEALAAGVSGSTDAVSAAVAEATAALQAELA